MSNTYRNHEDYLAYKKIENKRARERRKEYIRSKMTPCLFCGTTENIEFHHINPTKKVKTIASFSASSYAKIDEEISKCWCLCKSCHKKLHLRLVDPLPECYDM